MRGRARIMHRLDDADKLQRGDVLVAETTAPPWTPLFATAGGIVTDTGGILSHCAVVAREVPDSGRGRDGAGHGSDSGWPARGGRRRQRNRQNHR